MTGCPCDNPPFPPAPDIPAGLERLPRQLAGFPEFRRALLASIAAYPALRAWRARAGDDYGLMLLEWWAYVLDVLAFYSGEITGEQYLRTATRVESLRRLTELIGYQPKPPLASSATLAVLAEPGPARLLPAGTAFRSDAFGDEPPQVFESVADATIDPRQNQWTLAPIQTGVFGRGPLLLESRTAGVAEGQLVVLAWGGKPTLHAGRAKRVAPVRALDGGLYVQVDLDPPPTIDASQPVADMSIAVLALRAGLNPFLSAGAVQVDEGTTDALVLDARYPQLRVGDRVVLDGGTPAYLHATAIAALDLCEVPLVVASGSTTSDESETPMMLMATTAPTVACTRVVFSDKPPDWVKPEAASTLLLHFHAVPAGHVASVAKTELALGDVRPEAALVQPVEPLPGPTGGVVLLQDARKQGAVLSANVSAAADGTWRLICQSNPAEFPQDLRTPVAVFGNLVDVTRGETVTEVLGSGDATQRFQSFPLARKPLTYLADASSLTGRRNTLEVWIGGVRWREVRSLFFAGPDDPVYAVRQGEDGQATVCFGGGGYGRPLPTGTDNVRARYRYGGGAACPPAEAIHQFARSVQGLRRVVNPLAAYGGDDGDHADDIRAAAPASALALGRAVALADFEALARGYRGILNAVAVNAWDEREQRGVVKVYFIPPADVGASQLCADLAAHLRAIAAPGTPVTAALAVGDPAEFAVDYTVAADHDPAAVQAAVWAVLYDDRRGRLAPRNVPIGAPLIRGDILAAVNAVEGVDELRGLSMNGAAAPVTIAIGAAEGHYADAAVPPRTGGTG